MDIVLRPLRSSPRRGAAPVVVSVAAVSATTAAARSDGPDATIFCCSLVPGPLIPHPRRVPLLTCAFLVSVDERSFALSLSLPSLVSINVPPGCAATFPVSLSSSLYPLPSSSVRPGGLIDGPSCRDELGPVAAVFFGRLRPVLLERAHAQFAGSRQSLPAAVARFPRQS